MFFLRGKIEIYPEKRYVPQISKTVNGTTTKYYYDGDELILEKTGTTVIYYIHGPRIDELLSDSRGYCYHTDGLGSIVNLTDSAGAKANSYTYMAFGAMRNQSGTVSNPWLFTGRQYDSESGLYYLRARYYDAKIGRFLQEDPIRSKNLYSYCDSVGKPSVGVDPNLYIYTHNNPVNFTDPYGLWYIDINVSAGLGGGGTGGIIIGAKGIYTYGGGGAMSSPGFSATWSPDNPSPGWNVGFQTGYLGGFQTGYAFGKNGKGKGSFTEFGFVTPGVSLTGYYVSEPWKWPWYRDANDKDKVSKCKK